MDLKPKNRKKLIELYISDDQKHWFSEGHYDGILLEIATAYASLTDQYAKFYCEHVMVRLRTGSDILSLRNWVINNINYLSQSIEDLDDIK